MEIRIFIFIPIRRLLRHDRDLGFGMINVSSGRLRLTFLRLWWTQKTRRVSVNHQFIAACNTVSAEPNGQKIDFDHRGSSSLPAEPFIELQHKITSYLTPANYGDSSNNEVHPLFPGATVL